MKQFILISLLGLFFTPVYAQEPHRHDHTHSHDRGIQFPDIPGFKTLKCDFHQHTVFSDGEVWPSIRVQEAIRDGLDAISLTEHLEYQPHKQDIPHPDRNRSFEIAKQAAKDHDLLVVHGSEITRFMPPGHCNAIFIQDANKLLISDPIEVFREAKRQGAFVFWNHPNWTAQAADGIAKLSDMHKTLIKEGLLDGIEVVNDVTYSDEALQIALDNNLVIMGTSDIHGLVDWQYKVPEGGHRPITLVFAKEKTLESIREGLNNRRTVAWFNNLLVGKDDVLIPLIQASIQVQSAEYEKNSQVLKVMVENKSDAAYLLQNESPYTFHAQADVITINPQDSTEILIKTKEKLTSLELNFSVLNALNAPKSHPTFTLKIQAIK
ncbi:MAG: Sb-PDE family phosphodiesterase [Microscillaceae bacterium]|nr:Sb-PDE family phosphodiesterase [Microscillaceae bacterium]